MKSAPFQCTLVLLMVLLVFALRPVQGATVWVSAPKPKFPAGALGRGSEGYVIVRAFIDQDGGVTRATVVKSSGDATLDDAARTAMLKWKMNPDAVKPHYLTKGYEQRIDFRQEAPVAVRYRDRLAYFTTYRSAKIWMWAPYPEYPHRERRMRTEGSTVVGIAIGPDGRVESVVVLRSSGNANLDNSAVAAVRLWRAHKEYAGRRYAMPVKFTLSRGR